MSFSHEIYVIKGFVTKYPDSLYNNPLVKDPDKDLHIEIDGVSLDVVYGEYPRDILFIGEILAHQSSKYNQFQLIDDSEIFPHSDYALVNNKFAKALEDNGFEIIEPFGTYLVETAS